MMIKIIKYNQKRGGTVLLNSILVMSVAIMIVGYSNAYIGAQIRDYQQLDNLYKQKINKINNKSNNFDYNEFRNP